MQYCLTHLYFSPLTYVVLSRFVLELIAPTLFFHLKYVAHVLAALAVAAIVHVHVLRRRINVLVNLQNKRQIIDVYSILNIYLLIFYTSLRCTVVTFVRCHRGTTKCRYLLWSRRAVSLVCSGCKAAFLDDVPPPETMSNPVVSTLGFPDLSTNTKTTRT